ncbi:MAG: hypothetical protein JWM99_3305 [Verrucomicrobiales bacterium]|nr:hypothetical protein [Verrucomicrobiales bacterium]
MTFNKWTIALAAAGVVSIGSVQAEEQHQLMTALSSTTISGYVESSAIWEPGTDNTNAGRGNAAIPGRVFDGSADKLDGFNLHTVKLVIEKPLDEGQWSAGYKADLVFGPDAQFYNNAVRNGGSQGVDDFAIKQAYVALRAPVGNGLDVKLGVWDTIIGYEVFDSGSNPNFSRSFGFAIEPTHHTGVLLSYKINDMFTAQGGVANAINGGINDRAASDTDKTYLGSLTITLPESTGAVAGTAIYVGGIYGHTGVATAGGAFLAPTTSLYAGATVNTGLKGLAVGAAYDWRHNGGTGFSGTPFAAGNHNDLSVGALYVTYSATEKLKLAARAEYLTGSDGTFFDNGTAGIADKRNKLGEITFTADYSLWANVITRGEVRWDHGFNGHPYGGTDSARNAVTLAADLIYKF